MFRKEKIMKKRCTAIVLAAGSGKRMNSSTAKQFMLLGGKPLIYYALHTIEQSAIIDDCVLVTGEGDIPYVKKEIVDAYGFEKVKAVVAGGRERWESVAFALEAIKTSLAECCEDGYIFIHDGARPFLTEEILQATYEDVSKHHACVAAVPSKDTVKVTDDDGFVVDTPARKNVWIVQTPQVFDRSLISSGYALLQKKAAEEGIEAISVTDDASVVEEFMNCRVKMTMASYTNIKITTPEDLVIAENLL